MRIALVSPLEMRVPPIAYGGTELVVSLLAEDLVRRGHDVTLFASGDSVTSARLVSPCPKFLRGSGRDIPTLTMLNMLSCIERSGEFDIIHNHTFFEGMVMAEFTATPMLSTIHGALKDDMPLLFERYHGWYNTISHSAKRWLPPKERFVGVIHNAIEAKSYPLNTGPREDYLLFLSRISEEKGPHLAVEVAKALGKRLVIAGNVNAPDRQFFEQRVMPLVDGDQVIYVGEVDVLQKRHLLSAASCLLAPLLWEEPFGLFMAEANACGTPVVALKRGAAPEVVWHGHTGFVVEGLGEMVDAVRRIGEIDPTICRQHVERNFSVARMVDDYLASYVKVLRLPTPSVEVPLPRGPSAVAPLDGGAAVKTPPFAYPN